jgi:hypothetical protein
MEISGLRFPLIESLVLTAIRVKRKLLVCNYYDEAATRGDAMLLYLD